MKKLTRIAPVFLAASLLSNTPAFAEYQNVLHNINRAVEFNAKSKAISQGQMVSRLATGYIDALINVFPASKVKKLSKEGEKAVDAVVSTSSTSLAEYIGTSIGSLWQSYAEKKLVEKGRAEVKAREPEIRAKYNAGKARRAAEVDFAAKQKAITDRRAKTYGPDKPNAFY